MPKLFVICGHGAGDPGATNGNYTEANLVRALAAKIKKFGGVNVIVGNTAYNWYVSKMVNNTNIPKGSLVLELHMDSSPITSARGAHVVIDSNLDADEYDMALAKFISGILPGRAEIIKPRNDLANLNRAQAAGINYRILECGFVSNLGDVKVFNEKIDEIAKGILKSFKIDVISTPTESTSNKLYRVQVGAFSVKANAEKLMKELKSKGYNAIIKED